MTLLKTMVVGAPSVIVDKVVTGCNVFSKAVTKALSEAARGLTRRIGFDAENSLDGKVGNQVSSA